MQSEQLKPSITKPKEYDPINHDAFARRVNARFHPKVGVGVAVGALTASVAVAAFSERAISSAFSVAGLALLSVIGVVSSMASKDTREVKRSQRGQAQLQQSSE